MASHEQIVLDEPQRPYRPPEPSRGRPATYRCCSSLFWVMAILTFIISLFAAFPFTPSWNVAVDSIINARNTELGAQWWPTDPQSSAREIDFRIESSPLAPLTSDLRDKIELVRQAVERFNKAITFHKWKKIAGDDDSKDPNVPHQDDLVKYTQDMNDTLQSIIGRRVDSLDQHRQRYCMESYATVLKAKTRISRIPYIFSDEAKEQATKEEICKLSREHYNLLRILQPKNARVYDPMAKLRVVTHQLPDEAKVFLLSVSHCPRKPKVRRDSNGKCIPYLPGWSGRLPSVVQSLLFRDLTIKERSKCYWVEYMEEMERLTGQRCADHEKVDLSKMAILHSPRAVYLWGLTFSHSKVVANSTQDAWDALKRYTDRFKFLRLFDYQTHQRWQCSGWEELQQRELAADMEHDQRLDEQPNPEFWGTHLLNRSDTVLEGHLKDPEAVVEVYHQLLDATCDI